MLRVFHEILRWEKKMFQTKGICTIGLLLCTLSGITEGHFNVYLNLHEVMKLIGVSAELYYVREGQINDYALNFAVPVPANINEISFTWQSLVHYPLPYILNISTSNASVLPSPTVNISLGGYIPLEPQTFAINMHCTGSSDAEVEITIAVKIILDKKTSNITDLAFRRKKICLADMQDDIHSNKTVVADASENNYYVKEKVISGLGNDSILMENFDIENSPTRDISHNDIVERTSTTGVLNTPMLKESWTPPFSHGFVTLIIGTTLALVLVTILIIIAYCVKGPSKRRNHSVHLIKTSSFQRLPTISSTAQNSIYACPSSIAPTYATLSRSIREYECESEEFNSSLIQLNVPKCRVRLSCLVQEGTYGRIYRGTFNDCQEVLVKTVTSRGNQMQSKVLLQDSMIFNDIYHPKILSLMGVCIEDFNAPFILYMAGNDSRNLKLFLQEPSYARSITTVQIVLMSLQLASAVEYIHNHSIIHKDIAARNCVIGDQLCVKLCDNSLSRDLFPADYHCLGDGENRPIKWMSLEAIRHKHYNENSDVWAFGVLMWEMCTLGKMPFSEIDPFDMEHCLKDGYRLPQPFNCPDELFTIMAYCWASLSCERPSFTQLQMCLSDFHTQITRYV